ncbi:M3 family oligoendopeptidase, partial [Rhizobium ruizarguesonis]
MKIKLPHAGLLLSPAVPAGAADPALGDLPVWKLQDLYPSATSTAFVADMEKAGKAAIAFEEKWKSKLTEAAAKTDAEGIGAALKEYEALDDIIGRLGSFAGLTYFSDTTNPTNGKLYGDVQAKITEFSGHLLFFALELNRIDDAVIDACIANDPAAGHYRPWLLDLRKDKPYQLDDRLEQLFLEKSMTSAAAFNRLFDETMAELRYDIDGEKVPLEVALNRLQEKDPEARRKAAMALAETFKANIRTFTLITNTLAKDKEIADRWRGFEDIADSRHLANRVEREVVDALAAAVREAYPRLSHRYYKMKAKWLGMEHMNFWDRNAPLPETSSAIISWPEAKDTVLSAYGNFAPEMADIARRFFDEQWIDAPVRPGKAPGAFAHPTVPSAHPYVLVNYMGKPRDVMTLAHELGHGVHQVLAGAQGALMCQ